MTSPKTSEVPGRAPRASVAKKWKKKERDSNCFSLLFPSVESCSTCQIPHSSRNQPQRRFGNGSISPPALQPASRSTANRFAAFRSPARRADVNLACGRELQAGCGQRPALIGRPSQGALPTSSRGRSCSAYHLAHAFEQNWLFGSLQNDGKQRAGTRKRKQNRFEKKAETRRCHCWVVAIGAAAASPAPAPAPASAPVPWPFCLDLGFNRRCCLC